MGIDVYLCWDGQTEIEKRQFLIYWLALVGSLVILPILLVNLFP